jgi:hypothetical protein
MIQAVTIRRDLGALAEQRTQPPVDLQGRGVVGDLPSLIAPG